MNDFTKEELIELSLTLKWYDFDNIDIIEKIQAMIDNYCEHTNSNISFNCEDCELIL